MSVKTTTVSRLALATFATMFLGATAMSNESNKALAVKAVTDLFGKKDITAIDRHFGAGLARAQPVANNDV
jgi:hypothetical protein